MDIAKNVGALIAEFAKAKWQKRPGELIGGAGSEYEAMEQMMDAAMNLDGSPLSDEQKEEMREGYRVMSGTLRKSIDVPEGMTPNEARVAAYVMEQALFEAGFKSMETSRDEQLAMVVPFMMASGPARPIEPHPDSERIAEVLRQMAEEQGVKPNADRPAPKDVVELTCNVPEVLDGMLLEVYEAVPQAMAKLKTGWKATGKETYAREVDVLGAYPQITEIIEAIAADKGVLGSVSTIRPASPEFDYRGRYAELPPEQQEAYGALIPGHPDEGSRLDLMNSAVKVKGKRAVDMILKHTLQAELPPPARGGVREV